MMSAEMVVRMHNIKIIDNIILSEFNPQVLSSDILF